MDSLLNGNSRPSIFISYSHRDEKWLERLRVHLKVLERDYHIDRWDDGKITAGKRWRSEIKTAIDHSNIAILLISADFLASDFIHNNEIPPLLKSAEENGALVLPVIVSPCLFHRKPEISQFQSINPPSKPLISLSTSEQEEYLVKVAETVLDRLESLEFEAAESEAVKTNTTLESEDFFQEGVWSRLVKIGDWIYDREGLQIIGAGARSYLTSRDSFCGPSKINCSITWTNFGNGNLGLSSGFNAGIVFGFKSKSDGQQYYNIKISGHDIQLEKVGFRSGSESDFEHITKPEKFHVVAGQVYHFMVEIGEDSVVVKVDGQVLVDASNLTGTAGRVGLRPWRSQINCKAFQVVEI